MENKLSFADILLKYNELVKPALLDLENRFQREITAFENEYNCTVYPKIPTAEEVRFENLRIHLVFSHVAGMSYNLMVQRLGLDQKYYPLEQAF